MKPSGKHCEVDDATNPQDAPVLLLPPSTTSETSNNTNMYAAADDMDVESGVGDEISSSIAVPATSRTGRKRYASGLGNLGNTCFMNSSLQCLAHTEPLRRYFLSGDYEAELNRDNPLGTGGELATQFANLLSELWGVPAKRRNVMGNDFNYGNSTSAVYPRSFKHTLGRHAEQFMGYDQHDSQELATYLLDALHEDTNRVTRKPYVEKPEQGEDEPDEVAATKAWSLHLQREDSRILENFMGQVKSRVQCCEAECNRVSTTFDPFMYLSVPIPGATDRTIKVTFVPLDPQEKAKILSLTTSKTATMSTMLGVMNEQLVKLRIRSDPIPLQDLCPVDVWSHEIYNWYSNENELDRIRDTDKTFVYELRPVSEVQAAAEVDDGIQNTDVESWDKQTKYRSHRYKLDLETMTRLNRQDEWMTVLENYVQQPTLLYTLFSPNRGTVDDRMKFHQRLDNFIDLCHKETVEEESSGLKRAREESESESKTEVTVSPAEESIQALVDRSDASTTFKNVKNRYDIAILEFCSNKLRQFILRLIREKKSKYKDGATIQIIMRRPSVASGTHFSTKDHTFAPPLVLRVPSNMTVYGLRKELAVRFSRSLKAFHLPLNSAENGNSSESPSELNDDPAYTQESPPFSSAAMLAMRQIPLSYDKKGTYMYRSNIASTKKLGMVDKAGTQTEDNQPIVTLAIASDESERALVADLVGHQGTVHLDWPLELSNRCFDSTEYEAAEIVKDPDVIEAAPNANSVTTVQDCIEKYCQMEQLEETEMWYCNKCKKHVRAWKQFHLYRTPPILIIHLKRFHYSATTHRRDKINAFIDFPLQNLDLTDMVSHWSEEEKPVYDCYAVSNHYGGLGGGHYTAYTLSDDGTWCHYDDSRVTNNVDPKEVVSEAAYVLYYRRRDVLVGQDLINDGPSPAIVDDQNGQPRDSSEISSNNTAQPGDDDMAVEDADAQSAVSSRTCSSHMGSVDAADYPDELRSNDDFDPDVDERMASVNRDDYPLQ